MQGPPIGFWGSAASAIVGLAFAGQVATAAISGTEICRFPVAWNYNLKNKLRFSPLFDDK
jgi:hypothetical protein